MSATLFTGGRLLDPTRDELLDGFEVLVVDGRIAEVSDRPIHDVAAQRIDLRGKTLMPGLIDCHVHVVSTTVDGWANTLAPSSLVALKAGRIMETILQRGFTTVRDCCGADLGLVMAIEQGVVDGPRLIISGKGLTQTGGHCDQRVRTDDRTQVMEERLGNLGRIVDGVDNCRLAAREELRKGAKFIKIMANGGVSSPTDPIHSIQYSREEIRAIVDEAENAGTYVSAHLYTDKAIRRAVECGVHSLEHCNLIEPETARMAAEAGCIAVPTLVAYEGLALEGERFGLSKEASAKIETVRSAGLRSLTIMQEAGLPMAFGSDLLGELQKYHSMEFEILARALPNAEIIRSATLVGAKLCRMEGEVGVIQPGAAADLLVVDGDPYADIACLAHDGAHMPAIMSRGRFVKNSLH
ncbi:amidohydrolase family protein [Kaistia geumhonensis]|uniref:Imidazolonepropionase-like amidohydrolase n=1 Tax=Kaistia geumhonensis TaxID=410839 RepID=A0ABU0M1K7_9HYPH|nr:amidohydrolase family protein [Kaistia geumhonensis]MCX5479932.1 amidohydrolase family protein [Kaistia geumhonensis]MDQ0514840.1 imidazolonepropionase-like amidohydrolase [Kaistia geumhonensis]